MCTKFLFNEDFLTNVSNKSKSVNEQTITLNK